jgi:ABC-type bacteriocin/lantibiotic exporter with double-glycine peptidase domain
VPVGEVVHFHASRIALCQSLSSREKFFEGWLVSSVMKFSSWIVAAGQYFFCHFLKVLIAIRTSVLFEVFVAGVIPRTSPMGRWVVPFFFAILVFGCGCMLMHLGGIVATRVSLLCAISASVSSSSRTTPSVLSTVLVILRLCASWRAVIWSLFGGE